MRQIVVNKPIFHLAQPGEEDVRYTTRPTTPMGLAIRAKKQSLVDDNVDNLPTTLPEKQTSDEVTQNFQPTKNDDLQQVRDRDEEIRSHLPPEEADTDLFIGEALTNDALDLASPEDRNNYLSSDPKSMDQVLQHMKQNLNGVTPRFGRDDMLIDPSLGKGEDEYNGVEITPDMVDRFFRRRGY